MAADRPAAWSSRNHAETASTGVPPASVSRYGPQGSPVASSRPTCGGTIVDRSLEVSLLSMSAEV